MQLGWNEIRQRAIAFSREWAGEAREEAEAKSFWDAFFNVFGIPRRSVATFEEPVRKLGGKEKGPHGFIDLLWKGRLLVEHKSRGRSLERAESQAFGYIQSLAAENRHDEIPRYVIVTDFDRLALYDLEPEDVRDLPLFCGLHVQRVEIRVADLHRHLPLFAFIPGYKVRTFGHEDPVNLKAAEVMGQLHDALAAGGYAGHALERFLVRVLFCLFAEDTGLFDPNAFSEYLENHTRADGSDLGLHLERLFQVLNTPEGSRQRNLDDRLLSLPYVNGGLFVEKLDMAEMTSAMRAALLRCTLFDWSRISPAVFGSLFQAVMEPAARRQIGAHYTSERDILKVVRALFLDDLRAEFESLHRDPKKLQRFHEKLGGLKFFDPACGCGNFLVITYRELRALELDVLDALYRNRAKEGFLDVSALSRLNVDQMAGIEIEEWPARIAETALWLMDHQMNLLLAERFGRTFHRLPLRKTALIVHGNALRLEWKTILNPAECSYLLGNPPFVGKHYQTAAQRADMAGVFGAFANKGDLDYVTAWYAKAADFIHGTRIRVGFVSTNSITQGEQVPLLWGLLLQKGIKIHFAHRTFRWQSEARGKAHVHVVIIGFGAFDIPAKRLFDGETESAEATVTETGNISPYLTPGPDTLVTKRQTPLSPVPEMRCGNKPADGGHLILTEAEMAALAAAEPTARKYLRQFTGSEEFINGNMRWCLWLEDASPNDLRQMPLVLERIEKVRVFRLASSAKPTRDAAKTPTLFFYRSQPTTEYILIPEVSSERRPYIPIGLAPASLICSNKCFLIPGNDRYLLGLLMSAMHMAWMRQVGGRLESRYSYSRTMVYNTFPWPQLEASPRKEHATATGAASCVQEAAARSCWSSYHEPVDDDETPSPDGQNTAPRLAGPARKRAAVEAAAQAVLDVRAKYADSTLADLYDPLTMPPALVRAHAALDRAVDRCYRAAPFTSERQRVEYLFSLYEALTSPLLPMAKGRRKQVRHCAPGEAQVDEGIATKAMR